MSARPLPLIARPMPRYSCSSSTAWDYLGWIRLATICSAILLSCGTSTFLLDEACVRAAEPTRPGIDFENDLIPVFTKLGCNAGACHGSAMGRGGFKLSLYGGNPPADYSAIVHQLEGRRVNLSRPDQSLVILKPTEAIAHGGGFVMQDTESHRLLLDWISQGASYQARNKLERIIVEPSRVVAVVGDRLSPTVSAHYDDGTTRNVTDWVVFRSEDSSAVSIDDTIGNMTVHRDGRHIVIARYLGEVIPIEILVRPSDVNFSQAVQQPNNFIDQEIGQALTTLGLPASPSSDDDDLRRRITLHLTGRLPEIANNQALRLDRAALIEDLIDSEEFVEYWTFQFEKLLRVRPQPNDTLGTAAYHRWLSEQIRHSVGFDEIARTLILASGDSHQYGPANFYRSSKGPREQAEFFSELFLASRLRCANCHNHPLDRWTQDDYHGLAAIFAKIDPGQVVNVKPKGEVIHPQTLEPARPKIPGEYFLDVEQASVDYRPQLAQWLTSRENPYFAKALVNRLWKHLMGRGLVEPVDDFRATNPATHPVLLDKLAEHFVKGGYDFRKTLRLIANSSAYARSSHTLPDNRDDDRFYAHALSTPMEAEVLADALTDVLGIAEIYGDLPRGTRAVSLIDVETSATSLDLLGRCDRKDSCENVIGAADGLTQKLHLFNGALLNARIANPGSRLDKMLAMGMQPPTIVEDFYRVALGREPSEMERLHWLQQCQALPDALEHGYIEAVRSLLEDFVWALVTSQEFITK